MAEFHNFSDLKVISLLEAELLEVRNQLRRCPGYDPAESLAENAEMFVDCAQLLRKFYIELRGRYQGLKKEHENDKATARTYPIVGSVGNISPDDQFTYTGDSQIHASRIPTQAQLDAEKDRARGLLSPSDRYCR